MRITELLDIRSIALDAAPKSKQEGQSSFFCYRTRFFKFPHRYPCKNHGDSGTGRNTASAG